MEKSTRYIPWNAEADKEAEEYLNATQIAMNQSYEQYINPPDAELHNRIKEMKEALENSTRYIQWNIEANKKTKEYLFHDSSGVDWEKSCIEKTKECMLQSLRIKELEEQIVTYCRENPAAEEWFQITVNRENQ
jgi:hypothetical protein